MANLITSVPSIATTQWDVYFAPLLADPQITALPFDIAIGNMPREWYFNNNVDKITGTKAACAPSFKGTMSTFTKKTLTQIEVQANVQQCYTVMLKKLFGDKLPDGIRRGELSPEIVDFMVTQQKYAFNRDLLSLIFLGDTSVSADDYYVLMDGLYKKLATGAATVDGTVDATDSGIALTSTTLNTSNFYTTMKSVKNLQTRQLKNIPNAQKVWIWTEATYQLYTSYLTVATQNTAGSIQRDGVINGVDANTFDGIPIYVANIVDERLEADFLSSGSPVNPYRTVLTNPKNHLIYIDGNGFADADVFHEKLTNQVYALGSAMITYEYGYGNQNVIAGF